MTNSFAQTLFEEERSKAISAGLPIPTSLDSILHFNKRKSSLGLCTHYIKSNSYRISLSVYTLNLSENKVREIIAHELCHSCSPDGHGSTWHHYANVLNKVYGYKISVKADENTSSEFNKGVAYKYTLHCPCCGKDFYFSKMCNAVRYAKYGLVDCTACNVKLIRTK